jgi:ubiquinone/menaquinone biosynthesis C-methylase UbiE
MKPGDYIQSEFDVRAREWDKNKIHTDRSVSIAAAMQEMIPLKHSMRALEYGAGTGILSFLLREKFSEIILMDSSKEMIQICHEKAQYFQTSHITPLLFDLEHRDFKDTLDIIYSQMVLHHVRDIQGILGKFYSMLNPGGYLAIADLYPEDGSFHGPDVKVHLGFEPDLLIADLKQRGFKKATYKTCFIMKKDNGKEYPVFLLVAEK